MLVERAQLVLGSGDVFETVWRDVVLEHAGVGQVGHGLGYGAEGGWRVFPAHGAHKRDSNELFLTVIGG
jgi:hypothetical protein